MGLFLLAVTIVGAASLRTFVPALRPPAVAEGLTAKPLPLIGQPTKLSPCPVGTRPLRVSKLFPGGTIRGKILCVPDPKRAQGESSIRAPFINIAGEKQNLSEPIDLGELSRKLVESPFGPVLL